MNTVIQRKKRKAYLGKESCHIKKSQKSHELQNHAAVQSYARYLRLFMYHFTDHTEIKKRDKIVDIFIVKIVNENEDKTKI
jgi:hypothetical protein